MFSKEDDFNEIRFKVPEDAFGSFLINYRYFLEVDYSSDKSPKGQARLVTTG